MSRGPGWWLATDGTWYPPELHPQYVSPRQPTPQAIAGLKAPREHHTDGVALMFKTAACLVLIGGGVVTWRIVVHLLASSTSTSTVATVATASAAATIVVTSVLFFFAYLLHLLRALVHNTRRE
jgi:hypothetical protein